MEGARFFGLDASVMSRGLKLLEEELAEGSRLFWSQAAARSEWVAREWKLALDRRGLNYIDPVPLEEPDRAPPPQELAALHFSDAYLVYIAYERLKRELENRGQR